jgi:hypothetical protein
VRTLAVGPLCERQLLERVVETSERKAIGEAMAAPGEKPFSRQSCCTCGVEPNVSQLVNVPHVPLAANYRTASLVCTPHRQ